MAALTSGLSREETDAYNAAFERYDADHSGAIDEEELSCILEEQAGIKPSAKEIHELKETWMGHMHSTDQISADDFMHMMEAVRPAGSHNRNRSIYGLSVRPSACACCR